MDWRDLIAWQQVLTTTYHLTAANTGPVLVAQQNPSRIYLSISQNDGDNPHSVYPGQPPTGQTCGIPIGGATAFSGPGGAPSINLTGTGTAAPDGSGGYNISLTAAQQNLALAAVPATLEFWLDRHGCLPQLPWWFIADGCTVCIVVVEVIQERNPCDFTVTGQMRPPRPEIKRHGRSVLQTAIVRGDRATAVRRRWNVLRVTDGL